MARASFVLAIFVLSIFGCKVQPYDETWLSYSDETMGTTYHITIKGMEGEAAKRITDSVLIEVNAALSTYDTSSYISRFNRSDDGSIAVFPDEIYLREMFEDVWSKAYKIYDYTGGAFDPSASSLFNLWGFAEKQQLNPPNDEDIESVLKHVGFNAEVFPHFSKRFPYQQLNFNAIAKGYGVDKVMNALENAGMEAGMVEIGGEVRTIGKNKHGKNWQIGINRPEAESSANESIKIVALDNESMATSGNYRNFFEFDGQRYGHTIDPRTGYPVINDLLSATVITSNCSDADALATACMVLGKEKSVEFIKRRDKTRAIFIYKQGKEMMIEEVN